MAVAGLAAVGALLFAGATATLAVGFWLPIAVSAVAAIGALIGGLFVHFFVEERRRRRVELAFGHYLAPAIVDQLAESDAELQLGGQVREITVMFADLSNFTAVSDTMSPQELLELTNRYFKVIVEAIEATGGYVDKFVGDSVMALWSAPVPTTDSAAKAVAGALLAQKRVDELRVAESAAGKGFEVKIGLSTGAAIIGNVGSPRRFNYSALGGTVNLAARIEKVCGEYGCSILMDAATAAGLGNQYLVCEVDSVMLKGKSAAVSIYQPLALRQAASAEQNEYTARYAAALDLYRRGDLEQAALIWEEVRASAPRSELGSASTVMAGRARQRGSS
jgi:adenylate cyclase